MDSQVLDLMALGITPADILKVFSWGFGSVLFLWSLGYGTGALIKVIRLA